MRGSSTGQPQPETRAALLFDRFSFKGDGRTMKGLCGRYMQIRFWLSQGSASNPRLPNQVSLYGASSQPCKTTMYVCRTNMNLPNTGLSPLGDEAARQLNPVEFQFDAMMVLAPWQDLSRFVSLRDAVLRFGYNPACRQRQRFQTYRHRKFRRQLQKAVKNF